LWVNRHRRSKINHVPFIRVQLFEKGDELMIDLHCHILPELDDGAPTLTASIAMAKEAEAEGITSIVATPHHKNGSYDNVKQDILTSVASLNRELKKAGVNVDILPGQEIRMYGEILEDYEKDELLTLGGTSSYLFIEFHPVTYRSIQNNCCLISRCRAYSRSSCIRSVIKS